MGAFFGGWYALNIYYNIINKKVLKTVGLPWLVSWAQLVVGALYALVGWGIGRTGQPAVRDAWPVAVAHCGQQVTTVISLGAGAVSMTHVVKALEPLFSAAVNAVVRGEILPLPVYAALIPVVGGVAVGNQVGEVLGGRRARGLLLEARVEAAALGRERAAAHHARCHRDHRRNTDQELHQ